MPELTVKVDFDEEKFHELIEEFKRNNPNFVEVVRCKDCRYFVESKVSKTSFCNRHEKLIRMRPNEFCSLGKENKQ